MAGSISNDGSGLGGAAASKTELSYYLKNQKGDVVGGNFEIPKGDFSRFLGYKPPTEAEMSGKAAVSGGRTIELALQKEMSELGDRAQKSGMALRNMYIASGDVEGTGPGRDRQMIQSGVDSVKEGLDKSATSFQPGSMGSSSSSQYMKMMNEYQAKSKEDNMRYLEMQYKFLYASKSFDTVSNLMKVRNEAVRSSVRDAGK